MKAIANTACKLLVYSCLLTAAMAAQAERPNIILIMTDDQGYADLGCYGSEKIKTPHLDRMAAEGRRFTSFYMASSVCSPSRAALLTGTYPARNGMANHVIFPAHRHGLHPDEVTLADALKSVGYSTACIGKWHLGHTPELLPTAQGFDEYFGIPYSNDMNHPDNKGKPKGGADGMDLLWRDPESTLSKWKTPLMRNEEMIEIPVDQRTITARYTDEAIRFIRENKEQPFFIYLPHSMPHIPLYVPEDWYDGDPNLAYIRTIEHLDAETGRLLDVVRELGLQGKTYVIYTSDNGPWLQFKHHGGSAAPLRDGKGSTYEGGHRVPFLLWGADVPAGGVSDAFLSSMDLLPTLAAMAGAELKPRGVIDGLDARGTLLGDAPSPRTEMLYFSRTGTLEGIRHGDWKLLVSSEKESASPELYHLAVDIGERNNLAGARPEKARELSDRMAELEREINQNSRPRYEGQRRNSPKNKQT